MRASLVIPTLNEEESIAHVIGTFRAAADAANRTAFASDPIAWEILVVDGRSTDRTIARAEAAGARVVREPRRGYGRAYMTGFGEATGEIVATADGDASYPVEAIPALVRLLLDEGLDFLTTDRLSGVDRRAMTTEHRIGNRILNLSLNLAYRRWVAGLPDGRLRDSQSGMWVFRREILGRIHLTQDGMPMSEEIKIEALIHGLRVREVPIRYGERWGAPKLSSWRDGQKNLRFLFAKRILLEREWRAERRAAAAAARAERRARG
ncbi:MAG: glycosyltransferase family 2 protein [Thermoplasmata archaeon]